MVKSSVVRNESNKDIIFVMVLFFLSIFICLYKTNVDFNTYDDYRVVHRYVIEKSMLDLIPNELTFKGIHQWLKLNFEIINRHRYGLAPGIFFAPIIRLLDFLGLPISKFTFHSIFSIFYSLIPCCMSSEHVGQLTSNIKRHFLAIATVFFVLLSRGYKLSSPSGFSV